MGTVNQHANISGYFLFLSTLIMLFVSCGNDDNGTVVTSIPVENTAPSIQNQDFTVAEGIADADAIGTVMATDADNDALSFSITQNDNDLFAITEGGELSLTDSASLDFETAESHTITVEVTDGTDTASATVTINVTDVNENTAPVIENQDFTVAEDISDTDAIGTVAATDADNDALTYSISQNDNDLLPSPKAASFLWPRVPPSISRPPPNIPLPWRLTTAQTRPRPPLPSTSPT